MTNVVSLVEKKSAEVPEVSQCIADMLAMSKAGRVRAVYIIAKDDEGEILRFFSNFDHFSLLAGLALANYHVLQSCERVALTAGDIPEGPSEGDQDEEV